MSWLSIIAAIVTFLISGGLKKGKTATAAAAALGVGAGTYYLTHNTDWGRENLGYLDGVEVKPNPDGTGATASNDDPKNPSVLPIGQPAGGSGSSGANGLWNTLGSWLTSPAGQVTTGAAAGKALGVPNWMLWGGIGLGAYLILRD